MLLETSNGRYEGVKKIGFSDKIWRCLERSGKKNLLLKSVSYDTIEQDFKAARGDLTLAPSSVIRSILDKNSGTIKVVQDGSADSQPGLVALLPLSDAGLEAILNDRFSGTSVGPEWIVSPDQNPVAIYVWLIYMPGSFGRFLAAFAAALEPYLHIPVPIFTRPVNDHAVRLQDSSGFLLARTIYPNCAPDLRVALPERPVDVPKRAVLDVQIARNIEDIFRVFSVRSATYMAEQFCLYGEEFDGNDFCSTQFLGTADGDAAGCARLRFFDGFAKLERLAVRAEYRQSRLAYQLVRAAIAHCQKKGYRKVLGHSRLDLVRFWRVFGFQPIESRPDFSFANVRYTEILLELDPDPAAVTVDVDPMVMIRPEGAWDRPGPFDASLSANDPVRKKLLAQRTRTVRSQDIVV